MGDKVSCERISLELTWVICWQEKKGVEGCSICPFWNIARGSNRKNLRIVKTWNQAMKSSFMSCIWDYVVLYIRDDSFLILGFIYWLGSSWGAVAALCICAFGCFVRTMYIYFLSIQSLVIKKKKGKKERFFHTQRREKIKKDFGFSYERELGKLVSLSQGTMFTNRSWKWLFRSLASYSIDKLGYLGTNQ